MDAQALWAIVEAVHPRVDEDPRGFDAALAQHLAALDEPTIIAFSDAWDGLTTEAYTWDLWAAAWVLRGHCFEVAFMGFRDRLVALGHRVFERAVHDPATLADLAIDWTAGDRETDPWFCIAPTVAFHRVSGRELYEAGPPPTSGPNEPAGQRWDLHTVALRVPTLAAYARYDPARVRRLSPCPCCGYLTIQEPGAWEICGVCSWEDDDFVRDEPDEYSAPNQRSLNQARVEYRRRTRDEHRPTGGRPYPWEIPAAQSSA